jgi:hypothetical protein
MLTRGISHKKIDDVFHGLTLISFNYDRCLEHFLFNALQRLYDVDAKKAADICNNAQIFHPYGAVGALPYQNKNNSVCFGGIRQGIHM